MRLGLGSVMYDASVMSYVDNVAATTDVVRHCHERGVYVEAESAAGRRVDCASAVAGAVGTVGASP